VSRTVPYAIPPPRTFDEWLEAFGLSCERGRPDTVGQLSYEDFCETTASARIVRTDDGPLYGFWRAQVDPRHSGEARTVVEWLKDFGWEIVSPTAEDERDLHLFLEHDSFWRWSAGKVETGTAR
jgi:hypothetical protein